MNDIDRASQEPSLAVAEVHAPQTVEGFIKALRSNFRPFFLKADPPFSQRTGVIVAKGIFATHRQTLLGCRRTES